MGSRSRLGRLAAAVALVGVFGLVLFESEGGRPRIVPQYITNSAMLSDDGRTIALEGPCLLRSQTTVLESQTEVRVGVTVLMQPGQPVYACLGYVEVELDNVLGSRSLIDSLNGRVIEVEPAR